MGALVSVGAAVVTDGDVVTGGGSGGRVVTVATVPELRYAFLEASLATRFDSSAAAVAVVGAAAMLPLLAFVTLTDAQLRRQGLTVAVVALVIGATAGLPFGHYWVYALLAIPLVSVRMHRFGPVATALGIGVSLVVVTATTWGQAQFDIDDYRQHRSAAATVKDHVGADDRVVVWGRSPLLRVGIAAQTLGFAPTSNYFAWGLPEADRLLRMLERDLEEATVLVVDTSLDHLDHVPSIGRALALVRDRAATADCAVGSDAVQIYRFESC